MEFVKVAEGRWEVIAVAEDVSRLRCKVSPRRVVSIEEMNPPIRNKAGR